MANTKKFIKSVALAVNTEEKMRNNLTEMAELRNMSRSDLVAEMISENESYINYCNKGLNEDKNIKK